jgi:NNP family nitrate/nitrite transporter-like MFS transporter
LFGQAVALAVFGFMDKGAGVFAAIIVLAILSTFVNMAEGTSYGIVPYMIPEELAIVSAMVGAGGTLGAPMALNTFFRFFDNFTAFKLYAVYVMFLALTVPLMRWENLGSMFGGPVEGSVKVPPTPAKEDGKVESFYGSEKGLATPTREDGKVVQVSV